MRCRIVAAAFLGVWLVLLAGDFCEDVGFFAEDPAVDCAVDAALADLGQAVDTSHHYEAVWTAIWEHSPAAAALLPAPFSTNETFQAGLWHPPSTSGLKTFSVESSAVLLL
ncbi:MAG TPA: hypothetical protein VGH50_05825 [Candidatus Binatia bacterium]